MGMKAREIRRKHGSTGCHSESSANHRAPIQRRTQQSQHKNTLLLAALAKVMKLKIRLDQKTSHTSQLSGSSFFNLFVFFVFFMLLFSL